MLVAPSSLGMVVKVWIVRGIVNGEQPTKTEFGCDIWEGVEVAYTGLIRIGSLSLI